MIEVIKQKTISKEWHGCLSKNEKIPDFSFFFPRFLNRYLSQKFELWGMRRFSGELMSKLLQLLDRLIPRCQIHLEKR